MKAIVLAAGIGSRLKGLLQSIPKPMVEISGKPILQHNLEWLKRYGITDVYINLHHLPDIITRHCGDGARWGLRITYSHEPRLLGTAGAVKKIAGEFWNNSLEEPFLVVYGDNLLSEFDLHRAMDFHRRKKGIGTIGLYRKPQEVAKSGVAVLDAHDRIVRFIEKPGAGKIVGDLVNTGIYILEKRILGYVPENSACDFGRDVFCRVVDSGEPLYGFVWAADLIAVDTPELLAKVLRGKLKA